VIIACFQKFYCDFVSNGYYKDVPWNKFEMKLWTFYIDISKKILHENFKINVARSESVKGLSFKYIKLIRYAPVKVHAVFPNLVGYEACRNSLQKIGYENFRELFELQMIHLGHNYITEIPLDTFKDLKELKFLYLNENRIQNLDANVFSELRNLRLLIVDKNEITSLPERIFNI